jgi:delta8-fatty-acid desaturase
MLTVHGSLSFQNKMTPTPAEVRHRTTQHDDLVSDIDHHERDDRKLVGIDGKWYDVTDFISQHPGGPILEHFIGQDATAIFHANGHKDIVLKHRKSVGTYQVPVRHPADAEFKKLVEEHKKKGYYTTEFSYYVYKAIFTFSLMASFFICVCCFESWWMHHLGAVMLTFFWQQSALVMHDFMHTQVFRNRLKDRFFGVLFGTSCFGISAHWWRDEHRLHHGLTNTVDAVKRWADPQMWEMSWAQNTKLFPLFKSRLHYFLIKIQHITFVPVVVIIGRYEIMLDSFRLERRWYEWIGWAIHWTWMITLLSHLPTWGEVASFYFVAATFEGWLHFQLILSHYCKMFATIDEFHGSSWYVVQILTNLNIKNPWWQDWYYGGLNFHIEHHLFPTMCRKALRSASADVMRICKKYDIDYDYCYFHQALVKTLKHLKVAGSHYELNFAR